MKPSTDTDIIKMIFLIAFPSKPLSGVPDEHAHQLSERDRHEHYLEGMGQDGRRGGRRPWSMRSASIFPAAPGRGHHQHRVAEFVRAETCRVGVPPGCFEQRS